MYYQLKPCMEFCVNPAKNREKNNLSAKRENENVRLINVFLEHERLGHLPEISYICGIVANSVQWLIYMKQIVRIANQNRKPHCQYAVVAYNMILHVNLQAPN